MQPSVGRIRNLPQRVYDFEACEIAKVATCGAGPQATRHNQRRPDQSASCA